MFCTRCGVELRDQDRFCSQCGKATGVAPAEYTQHPPRTLALDKRRKKVAGVCAGFARYLDADATLVRIVVLVLALSTGIGFVAYLVAWLLMPSDYAELSPRPSGDVIRQPS
jgi:phage shock protein C